MIGEGSRALSAQQSTNSPGASRNGAEFPSASVVGGRHYASKGGSASATYRSIAQSNKDQESARVSRQSHKGPAKHEKVRTRRDRSAESGTAPTMGSKIWDDTEEQKEVIQLIKEAKQSGQSNSLMFDGQTPIVTFEPKADPQIGIKGFIWMLFHAWASLPTKSTPIDSITHDAYIKTLRVHPESARNASKTPAAQNNGKTPTGNAQYQIALVKQDSASVPHEGYLNDMPANGQPAVVGRHRRHAGTEAGASGESQATRHRSAPLSQSSNGVARLTENGAHARIDHTMPENIQAYLGQIFETNGLGLASARTTSKQAENLEAAETVESAISGMGKPFLNLDDVRPPTGDTDDTSETGGTSEAGRWQRDLSETAPQFKKTEVALALTPPVIATAAANPARTESRAWLVRPHDPVQQTNRLFNEARDFAQRTSSYALTAEKFLQQMYTAYLGRHDAEMGSPGESRAPQELADGFGKYLTDLVLDPGAAASLRSTNVAELMGSNAQTRASLPQAKKILTDFANRVMFVKTDQREPQPGRTRGVGGLLIDGANLDDGLREAMAKGYVASFDVLLTKSDEELAPFNDTKYADPVHLEMRAGANFAAGADFECPTLLNCHDVGQAVFQTILEAQEQEPTPEDVHGTQSTAVGDVRLRREAQRSATEELHEAQSKTVGHVLFGMALDGARLNGTLSAKDDARLLTGGVEAERLGTKIFDDFITETQAQSSKLLESLAKLRATIGPIPTFKDVAREFETMTGLKPDEVVKVKVTKATCLSEIPGETVLDANCLFGRPEITMGTLRGFLAAESPNIKYIQFEAKPGSPYALTHGGNLDVEISISEFKNRHKQKADEMKQQVRQNIADIIPLLLQEQMRGGKLVGTYLPSRTLHGDSHNTVEVKNIGSILEVEKHGRTQLYACQYKNGSIQSLHPIDAGQTAHEYVHAHPYEFSEPGQWRLRDTHFNMEHRGGEPEALYDGLFQHTGLPKKLDKLVAHASDHLGFMSAGEILGQLFVPCWDTFSTNQVRNTDELTGNRAETNTQAQTQRPGSVIDWSAVATGAACGADLAELFIPIKGAGKGVGVAAKQFGIATKASLARHLKRGGKRTVSGMVKQSLQTARRVITDREVRKAASKLLGKTYKLTTTIAGELSPFAGTDEVLDLASSGARRLVTGPKLLKTLRKNGADPKLLRRIQGAMSKGALSDTGMQELLMGQKHFTRTSDGVLIVNKANPPHTLKIEGRRYVLTDQGEVTDVVLARHDGQWIPVKQTGKKAFQAYDLTTGRTSGPRLQLFPPLKGAPLDLKVKPFQLESPDGTLKNIDWQEDVFELDDKKLGVDLSGDLFVIDTVEGATKLRHASQVERNAYLNQCMFSGWLRTKRHISHTLRHICDTHPKAKADVRLEKLKQALPDVQQNKVRLETHEAHLKSQLAQIERLPAESQLPGIKLQEQELRKHLASTAAELEEVTTELAKVTKDIQFMAPPQMNTRYAPLTDPETIDRLKAATSRDKKSITAVPAVDDTGAPVMNAVTGMQEKVLPDPDSVRHRKFGTKALDGYDAGGRNFAAAEIRVKNEAGDVIFGKDLRSVSGDTDFSAWYDLQQNGQLLDFDVKSFNTDVNKSNLRDTDTEYKIMAYLKWVQEQYPTHRIEVNLYSTQPLCTSCRRTFGAFSELPSSHNTYIQVATGK